MLAATIASTIGSIAVVAVWGVAFGAFPTLTQTVMLRAAGDATDAAPALVNATTNIGIAGGALLGSRLLGVVTVPGLGWVGAGLVAVSLVVYATTFRRPDALGGLVGGRPADALGPPPGGTGFHAFRVMSRRVPQT